MQPQPLLPQLDMSAICPLPFRPGLRTSAWRVPLAFLSALATALILLIAPSPVAAAPQQAAADKERPFLAVLQTNAPPAEKALACKQLAIYGTKAAVPALAPLLADPQLASWARIALEAIPDPAADAALRQAMGKLHGRLLVGVINSLGCRHDAKATSALIKQLKQSDPEVASAAAVALGRIGGPKSAKALGQALAKASPDVRSAVAEGCIRCAENFLTQSNAAQAVKLYDTVRQAAVPTQRALEATRGAILARQSAGVPLLLEQLRAPDKARFGIGLRTARELPGRAVTEALVAELPHCPAERQPYLLLAVGDRQDGAVLPAVLKFAESGPAPLRLVAVNLLDRLGKVSSVPVLLVAATGPDAELAAAAQAVLARLPGTEVDADLLSQFFATGPNGLSSEARPHLSPAQAKLQQVFIQLSVQRHLDRAVPLIVASVDSSDAAVRATAVQALGALGDEHIAGSLVALLSRTQSAQERADIETALIALGSRKGAACVPALLELTQSRDSALRTLALHALASAGGPGALAAVSAAVTDPEETVQDEAVRTLASWPSTWPEDAAAAEPLLSLAQSGKKPSYQVLGLRGYLQLLQGDKQLKPEEKVARLKALLPLLQRPEEKRQTITILEANPTADGLELLLPFAAESAVAEDACSALVKLADRTIPGVSSAQRQHALQTVTEHSKDDTRRKRAQELLKTAAKQS